MLPGSCAQELVIYRDCRSKRERGYLVESGGDVDHMVVPYGHDSNVRPIVHSDDMLRALEEVYTDREIANLKAMEAREWTLQHTWDHARAQWQKLFAEVEEQCRDLCEVG